MSGNQDSEFERHLGDLLAAHLDGTSGPDPRWLGPEHLRRRGPNRPGNAIRTLALIAAAIAIFTIGVTVGQRLMVASGPCASGSGPVESGGASVDPSASLIASTSAVPSGSPEGSAPLDASGSPSASPSLESTAPSPTTGPEASGSRYAVQTWWNGKLVVRSSSAGVPDIEIWDLAGHGVKLTAVAGANPAAVSDGRTLLVDRCTNTVSLYDASLKERQIQLGSGRPGGVCHPFASMGTGGYYTWRDGAITVIQTSGTVVTKPIPAGYVVLSAQSNGNALLLRAANSDPLDFAGYQWDSGAAKPQKLDDHFTGVMAGDQSPDYVFLGYMRRTDSSWWATYDNGGNTQNFNPLPDGSEPVARSFIAPSGDIVAEQAVNCATGCLSIVRQDRSLIGRIDGPINEVVAADHMLAISTDTGVWVVTTTAAPRQIGAPATLTAP